MSPYLCRPSAPLLTGFSPQTLGISRNRSLSVPNLKLLLLKNSSLASKYLVEVFDIFSNPKSEIQNSSDHLVRPVQHGLRNREADLLGRLQVDDQLEFRWLLHGKIAWLGTFQDLIHVSCDTAKLPDVIRRIGHEATGLDY